MSDGPEPSRVGFSTTYLAWCHQRCVDLWPVGGCPGSVAFSPQWAEEHLPLGLGEAIGPGRYPLVAGATPRRVIRMLKRAGFQRLDPLTGAPDWEVLKPSDVSFRLCPEGVEFLMGGRVEAIPWWWILQYHLVDYGVSYEACRPGCHPVEGKRTRVAAALVRLGFKQRES